MSFRKFSRRLHLWIGLPLSLILLVICLTGSLLVYYVEIDDFFYIDTPTQPTQLNKNGKDWDTALVTLRQQYPEKTGPWRFNASSAKSIIYARYYNPKETKDRIGFSPKIVWLSADGKHILNQSYWGDTPMTFVYNLHFQLLSGNTGMIVIGCIGVMTLVLLLSGFFTWLPKKGQLKKAFLFKQRKAKIGQLYDWHKTLGYSSLLPAIVITLTGVMMALPKQSNYVLEQMVGEVAKPKKHQVLAKENSKEISLNKAIIIAQQQLASGALAWIETSSSDNKVYRFRFQVDSDPSARFPHTYIEINSLTGELVSLFDIRDKSTSNKINNWLHPLHDGSILGNTTRIAWLVIGVMMSILIILGVYRWLYRTKLRPEKR